MYCSTLVHIFQHAQGGYRVQGTGDNPLQEKNTTGDCHLNKIHVVPQCLGRTPPPSPTPRGKNNSPPVFSRSLLILIAHWRHKLLNICWDGPWQAVSIVALCDAVKLQTPYSRERTMGGGIFPPGVGGGGGGAFSQNITVLQRQIVFAAYDPTQNVLSFSPPDWGVPRRSRCVHIFLYTPTELLIVVILLLSPCSNECTV